MFCRLGGEVRKKYNIPLFKNNGVTEKETGMNRNNLYFCKFNGLYIQCTLFQLIENEQVVLDNI